MYKNRESFVCPNGQLEVKSNLKSWLICCVVCYSWPCLLHCASLWGGNGTAGGFWSDEVMSVPTETQNKTAVHQSKRSEVSILMLKAIVLVNMCMWEREFTWIISRPGWGYSNTGSCSSIFMSPISSGSAPWLTRYTTSCNKLVPMCMRGRKKSHIGCIIDGTKMALPAALNSVEYLHMHLPKYRLTCNPNGLKPFFSWFFILFVFLDILIKILFFFFQQT